MTTSFDNMPSENRFCAQCGARLQKGANFCTNCGHPVDHDFDDSAETVQMAQEVSEDPTSSIEQEEDDLGRTQGFVVGQIDLAQAQAATPHKQDPELDPEADREIDPVHDLDQEEDPSGSSDESDPNQTQPIDMGGGNAADTQPISAEEILRAHDLSLSNSEKETERLSSSLPNQEGEQETEKIGAVPVRVPDKTAELPVQETLKRVAQQSVTYSARKTAYDSGARKKRIALVAALIAIIVIIAIAVAVVFGLGAFNAPEQETDTPVAVNEPAQQVVVDLSQSYSTKFASQSSGAYPEFTFKYPSSWSITDEMVTSRGEKVQLTSSTGVAINFEQRAQSTSSADTVTLKNATKAANASFVPHKVQGSDYSDLGSFIVLEATLNINGKDQGLCYALVPESALQSTTALDLRCHVPGFWYGSTITFTSQPTGQLDEQTKEELIAILASFTESKSAKASDTQKTQNSDQTTITTTGNGDYILPDSSTKKYTEQELSGLSAQDLYLARNEIFARHGRIFSNSDLQSYFESKSWYKPSIEPGDFSDSLLNETELANVELLSKLESSRGSSTSE